MKEKDNNLTLTVRLSAISDATDRQAEKISKELADLGVAVITNRLSDDICYLTLSIDKDKLNKFRTRSAGRRRGTFDTKGKWNVRNLSVGEVSEMRNKGMTHKQIIEYIGCPRTTYYTALRRTREGDVEMTDPFFVTNIRTIK